VASAHACAGLAWRVVRGRGVNAHRYQGVNLTPGLQLWRAAIVPEGGHEGCDLTVLGLAPTEEAAARLYDEAAASMGRPVNFPTGGQEQAVVRRKCRPRFAGTHWHSKAAVWSALLVHGGQVRACVCCLAVACCMHGKLFVRDGMLLCECRLPLALPATTWRYILYKWESQYHVLTTISCLTSFGCDFFSDKAPRGIWG